jgi:hypothetical protein
MVGGVGECGPGQGHSCKDESKQHPGVGEVSSTRHLPHFIRTCPWTGNPAKQESDAAEERLASLPTACALPTAIGQSNRILWDMHVSPMIAHSRGSEGPILSRISIMSLPRLSRTRCLDYHGQAHRWLELLDFIGSWALGRSAEAPLLAGPF